MLKGMLISKIVGSAFRSSTIAIGGYLVANGYGDESTIQEVVGAIGVLGGFALSLAEKKFARL